MTSIPDSELAAHRSRLKELIEECKVYSGGGDKALRTAMIERGASEFDVSAISKWRNSAHDGKVPNTEQVDALAKILVEKHESQPDEGEDRVRQLRAACESSSSIEQGDIQQVLQDTRRRIRQRTTREHPFLPNEIALLFSDSLLHEALSVLEDPSRLAYNLKYTINISGSPGAWQVVTENEAARVYPNTNEVFASFCSTPEAMNHEYQAQGTGCISRELVSTEGSGTFEEWRERVDKYRCQLQVDAEEIPVARVVEDEDADGGFIVRRYFDVFGTAIVDGVTPTSLRLAFDLASDVDHFPVHFSSYYCVGTTRIRFSISDAMAEPKVVQTVFLPSSIASPFKVLSNMSEVELVTPQRTILPPGSGVVFRWHV